MNRVLRSTVMLVSLAASGCVLFQPPRLVPTAETAVVHAGEWGEIYRGGYVRIDSVSGRTPSWSNSREIAVGRGQQTGVFEVLLCLSGERNCPELARAELRFETEPGHTYLVRAREKVNGSNQFWVWVEDEQTGALAGGSPPPSR